MPSLCLTWLLVAGIPVTVQAGWLDTEWRNFRTYPRLQKAYDAFRKADYPRARALIEEVERIDPNKRDARILHAQICGRLADAECLQQLGLDWQTRQSTDALGHYLLAAAAAIRKDDEQVIEQLRLAMERAGLGAKYRQNAAQSWMDALIRQNRLDEARAVLDWLEQQGVAVSAQNRGRWQRQLATQPVEAPPASPGPAVATAPQSAKKPRVTKVPPAKALAGAALVAPSPPSARPPVTAPEPKFPYAELSASGRTARLGHDFQNLIRAGRENDLTEKLLVLRRQNLFTPAVQEALALSLQANHCTMLLQQIPVSGQPSQTTERSQMAAAFCASTQPERAAQHFAAASHLRQQAGLAPTAQALRGEGDAWLAAGRHEAAMLGWDRYLQLQPDPAVGRVLADLALQHPELASSAAVMTRYAAYLPPGQLALRRARAARQQGDWVVAEAAMRQALAENPSAALWYELAGLMRAAGNATGQGAALAQALVLKDDDALMHAEYGYWLKADRQAAPALQHFKRAFELDTQRLELLPEMALLENQLGQFEAAVAHWRASIDAQQAIQSRLQLSSEAAQQQMYGWQRMVQMQEDRWSGSVGMQLRLNHGPDGAQATSPTQFALRSGALDAEVAYRLDPLWDAAHPSWLFASAVQGLEDRSFRAVSDNRVLSAGVRQRLLKDANVIGSVAGVMREGSEYRNDVMLRVSGSHSAGADWQPGAGRWNTFNLYGDVAWLTRANSYFLTLAAETGIQQRLSGLDGKSSVSPFIGSTFSMNNDNAGHHTVSHLDVSVGVALTTWHGGDTWRAPDVRNRLSVEFRQRIGGNSRDDHTVLLQWRLFR